MTTLLKFIQRDKDAAFFKVVDSSITLHSEPNDYKILPIHRGKIIIVSITDTKFIDYFTNVLFSVSPPYIPFEVKIYNNIDHYDPNDIELALNIRAVHYSPYPDYEFKNCAVSKVETTRNIIDNTDVFNAEISYMQFKEY